MNALAAAILMALAASHEIHLFQPAAVLAAINDVVASVRTKQPLRPRP